MTPTPPKLSVILPCLNEASHLEQSIQTICSELSFLDGNYEMLVIDDGSSDDTWQAICRCAAKTDQIRGLRLSRRFGKELALTAGLEHARGEAVLLMDSDLQHPPSMIPEMVRIWSEEHYDVVEAVKEKRGGESLASRVKAYLFSALHRRMSGIDLRNASDFKLMDRKVVDAWSQMPERNVFFRGMSAWLGFRRKQIPFTVAPRVSGRTSWTQIGLIKLAITGITAYSSAPIQLIPFMGMLFIVFAAVLGSYTLAAWFAGDAVEGFTTVIILQLLTSGIIMTALSILGAYLSNIYHEVKGRPRYLICENTESPRNRTDS
jgi:glycosyltransferase involved in cell wall biosynthesis